MMDRRCGRLRRRREWLCDRHGCPPDRDGRADEGPLAPSLIPSLGRSTPSRSIGSRPSSPQQSRWKHETAVGCSSPEGHPRPGSSPDCARRGAGVAPVAVEIHAALGGG
jgi:hypothetical protein